MPVPKDIYERVQSEYLKGISIPRQKSQNQFFLCPVGYTGAGKSTVLSALERHFSFIRLSTDEIRKLFREHGYGRPGSTESKELYDELVERFTSEGYDIAYDAHCGNAKERIEERARRYGVRVIWILIDPPEEFIINKLKNYHHTWLYRDGNHAIERYLYHKKRATDRSQFPFLFTFDPSRNDLAEQASRCATLIRRELVEKPVDRSSVKFR